jgi:hypothetical protein
MLMSNTLGPAPPWTSIFTFLEELSREDFRTLVLTLSSPLRGSRNRTIKTQAEEVRRLKRLVKDLKRQLDPKRGPYKADRHNRVAELYEVDRKHFIDIEEIIWREGWRDKNGNRIKWTALKRAYYRRK